MCGAPVERLLMLLLRGFTPEPPGGAAGCRDASGRFSPPPAGTAALASAIFSLCGCDPRQAAPHPSAAKRSNVRRRRSSSSSSHQSAELLRFGLFISLFLSQKAKARRELAPGSFPAERFLQDNAGHRLFASDVGGNYDQTRSPVSDSLCQ